MIVLCVIWSILHEVVTDGSILHFICTCIYMYYIHVGSTGQDSEEVDRYEGTCTCIYTIRVI